MYTEFLEFLKKYGVLALAIAVIIGGKLNLLVTSLVNDILTPVIFQPALNAAGVKNIAKLSYHGVFYGKFVSALLDFCVVAFIVFLIARKLAKEDVVEAPK